MSEWVSVEDRLPEDGQRVLFVAHASVWHGRVCLGEFVRDALIAPQWPPFRMDGGKALFASHWMPLPDLPEGVER